MLLISSDYPPPLEDSPGIREIEPSESLRGSKITGRGSPTCPTRTRSVFLRFGTAIPRNTAVKGVKERGPREIVGIHLASAVAR